MCGGACGLTFMLSNIGERTNASDIEHQPGNASPPTPTPRSTNDRAKSVKMVSEKFIVGRLQDYDRCDTSVRRPTKNRRRPLYPSYVRGPQSPIKTKLEKYSESTNQSVDIWTKGEG